MKTTSRILATVCICTFAGMANAAIVTANQAQTAVSRWLGSSSVMGSQIKGEVSEVRTCSPTNGASFHVVKLSEGGFVVTSADTEREPIVAFSSGSDLVEDERNPLWVLLRNDLALRTQGGGSSGGMQ